jgi:raffinose/stachyose/melibiose transport system permease protein
LKNPVAFPEGLYLGNFVFLFTRTQIPRAILNTLFLTVVSEVLIVLVVPLSSYAIARNPGVWTNGIYAFFIGGMMIPFQAYMISLFRELKFFNLFGTFAGTIIIYLSGAVAFGTLLFTSFIKTTVPVEIEESARIDGANIMQLFWKIVFPLLAPCTASMIILNGLGIWNDFLMPSLMLSSKQPVTLNVEIFHFVGQFNTRWGIVFAGAVICIIPAISIFIALQKYFIKGIAAGAVKG